MPLNIPSTISQSKINIENGSMVDCVALENIKKNSFVTTDNLLRIDSLKIGSGFGSTYNVVSDYVNIDGNVLLSVSDYSIYSCNMRSGETSIVSLNDYGQNVISMVYLNNYLYVMMYKQYTTNVKIVKYTVNVNTRSLTKVSSRDILIDSSDSGIYSGKLLALDSNMIGFIRGSDNIYMFFIDKNLTVGPISKNPGLASDDTLIKIFKIDSTHILLELVNYDNYTCYDVFEISGTNIIKLVYQYKGNYNEAAHMIYLEGSLFISAYSESNENYTHIELYDFTNTAAYIRNSKIYHSAAKVHPIIYRLSNNMFSWFNIYDTEYGVAVSKYLPKRIVYAIQKNSNTEYSIVESSSTTYINTSGIKFGISNNDNYCITASDSSLEIWTSYYDTGIVYYHIDTRNYIKTVTNATPYNRPCIGLTAENINKDSTGKVIVIKGGHI